MAIVQENGILLNVNPYSYNDKKTGEPRKGIAVTIAKPVRDPKYDGHGMKVHIMYARGDDFLARSNEYLAQAKGLYMRPISIKCDMVPGFRGYDLIPLEIATASHSPDVLKPELSKVA